MQCRVLLLMLPVTRRSSLCLNLLCLERSFPLCLLWLVALPLSCSLWLILTGGHFCLLILVLVLLWRKWSLFSVSLVSLVGWEVPHLALLLVALSAEAEICALERSDVFRLELLLLAVPRGCRWRKCWSQMWYCNCVEVSVCKLFFPSSSSRHVPFFRIVHLP